MEHQDSYGCRECSNGHKLRAVSRPSLRCQAGPPVAGRHRTAASAPASDHGSSLRRQRNPPTGAGFRLYPGSSPQEQSSATVAVRQGPLPQAERSGTALSPTQGLPSHLLSLRQTRRPLSWISQLRLNRRGPTIVLTRPSRRFCLCLCLCFCPTNQGSLVIDSGQETRSDPSISSVTLSIMITTSNSPVKGSG